jgi:hypothetical protein
LVVLFLWLEEMGPLDLDLHYAVRDGDLKEVRKLLDKGADVNARDKYGWTPLHEAASYGHLDIVKLLVERGADVNARDKDGRTPLDLAKRMKPWDIADFLENYRESTVVEIADIRHSPLSEGLWGRIFVLMRGSGNVNIDLEGDVDWIDPGEIFINGEDTVEIPVKPKIHGEVPVKITVKGGEKSTSKIVWLDVKYPNISEQIKARPTDSVLWIEEEIERIKGFLVEIEES